MLDWIALMVILALCVVAEIDAIRQWRRQRERNQ